MEEVQDWRCVFCERQHQKVVLRSTGGHYGKLLLNDKSAPLLNRFPSQCMHMNTQAKSIAFEQEIYDQFTYKKDRSFFHSFPGDVSS